MAKKNTTSFNVSTTLKNALVAKGINVTPDVNHVYYNGANETHLLIADMSDGTFRCIIKSTSGVDFDFHSIDDPSYIRMYTERELFILMIGFPGVTNYVSAQQGANWTYTITRNGQNYVGEDQNIADAQAEALIAMINAS